MITLDLSKTDMNREFTSDWCHERQKEKRERGREIKEREREKKERE